MWKKIFVGLIAIVVVLGVFIYIAQKKTKTVVVEHTFNAPVAKVWTLWNDPESMKKWWGPKGFSAPVIKNDLQVGGTFLLSMKAPDGKVSWNVGKYTEVLPNEKIAAVMSFSDENGNVVPASTYGVPGEWPIEVTVTVEFKDLGDKTHIKITETGIPMIMYVFAKMGWEQQFVKFAELL
ncbi:SRPBCC domain-containing protein [Bdellovibrio sp. 22V]|uniref:SRPBCC family protein n=1 Tax=Bdellovibrio TaxID=958 RepID=UPI002543E6E7|nr:SRPBCC domain-containing protein [Bdellovibrio sp. 22V]WII72614.1 SRPBCC domain-containing protein [Bdellovibrio sp. 22V]